MAGPRFAVLLGGPDLDRIVALGRWCRCGATHTWDGATRTWRDGGTWMVDDFSNGRVDVLDVSLDRARLIARDLSAAGGTARNDGPAGGGGGPGSGPTILHERPSRRSPWWPSAR